MDLDSAMVSWRRSADFAPAGAVYLRLGPGAAVVELLADLRPTAIGAGHGEPMFGRAVAIG